MLCCLPRKEPVGNYLLKIRTPKNLQIPQSGSGRARGQGVDMELLKGSSSYYATLPSGLFLEGGLQGSLGGLGFTVYFSRELEIIPPNFIPSPLSTGLTLPCGPALGIFLPCFGALIPILAMGPEGWESAWGLPARDNIWKMMPLLECSLQGSVRKCHWPAGCAQKHLFWLKGWLNLKIIVSFFFLWRFLQMFENQLRGEMSDNFKSRFLLLAEFLLAVYVCFEFPPLHSFVLMYTLSGLFHGWLMSL